MATLFGVDVAALVRTATSGQLFAGTITRRINRQFFNYTFEGVPGTNEEVINNQALSTSTSLTILIIANSISPRTTPLFQDTIKLLNKEYVIVSVETDSAEATHTCTVSLK